MSHRAVCRSLRVAEERGDPTRIGVGRAGESESCRAAHQHSGIVANAGDNGDIGMAGKARLAQMLNCDSANETEPPVTARAELLNSQNC